MRKLTDTLLRWILSNRDVQQAVYSLFCIMRCQRMQIRQRCPTPGCTQTCQPSGTITEVNKRAGKRHQILYQRPVFKPLNINSIEGNTGLLQLLCNRPHMTPATDQNGDALLQISGQ